MKRGRNPVLWAVVLLFILADIGIGLWLWNRYQASRRSYSAAGLNLRYLPEQNPPAAPARPPTEHERQSLAFREKSGLQMIPQETYLKLDRAGTKTAGPAVYKKLWKGARAFKKMAMSSRYRQTKALGEWASDFRTYPDLAAMMARFRKDKDIHLFLASVVRSPNFSKMIRRYGSSPDVQNFYKDALKNKDIAEAAQAFFEDKNIFHSVKAMKLPGLPSIGALMAAGAAEQGTIRWDKIQENALIQQTLREQANPGGVLNDRRR